MTAELDYTALRFWFDLAQLLGTLGVAVYVWWTSRTRATQTAINAVGDRVDALGRRIDQVESELKHAPDGDDWKELDARLDMLNRQIGELTESQRATNRLLHVINEHLLRDKA